MMNRDQQERLRKAYAAFEQRAQVEDPQGKEEVDALLQSVYQQARPPMGTLAALPYVGVRALDVELADVPEIVNVWGALHEELPGDIPPAYGLEDSRAELEFRRRRLPQPEPEVVKVLEDGGLLGSGRYQILDPNWIEGAICWLSHLFDRVEFNPDGPVIPMDNVTSMALVGDWGVQPCVDVCGNQGVARAMRSLEADLTVHLGDVYYAGTRDEVRENFLSRWPVGRRGSLALNSNHEMYSGGHGYFGVTLQHAAFRAQRQASFFALENDHWVVVGLDTAFHARRYQLYRTGRLNDDQLDFLAERVASLNGRQLLLMSHHQGLELSGKPTKKLWRQVQRVLAGHAAIWYWGHLHSAVVYDTVDNIRGRCCGHGAMPRGRAEVLEDNDRVLWFGNRQAADPNVPLRVVNGLAYLEFDGPRLREVFYDEQGQPTWWSWATTRDDDPPSRLELPDPLIGESVGGDGETADALPVGAVVDE